MGYDAVIDSTKLNGKLNDIAAAIKDKGNLSYNFDFYGGDFENAIYNLPISQSPIVNAYPDEASIPAVGQENEIAVITTQPIHDKMFDSLEPAVPYEGDVWVKTTVGSVTPFPLDSKKNIIVYPAELYQFHSNKWEPKLGKCFQDGVWKEWKTYLFKSGDDCEELTGGYSFKNGSSISSTALVLHCYNGTTWAQTISNNIDVTPYRQLCINLSSVMGSFKIELFSKSNQILKTFNIRNGEKGLLIFSIVKVNEPIRFRISGSTSKKDIQMEAYQIYLT